MSAQFCPYLLFSEVSQGFPLKSLIVQNWVKWPPLAEGIWKVIFLTFLEVEGKEEWSCKWLLDG
jgi:hypothetical protein